MSDITLPKSTCIKLLFPPLITGNKRKIRTVEKVGNFHPFYPLGLFSGLALSRGLLETFSVSVNLTSTVFSVPPWTDA